MSQRQRNARSHRPSARRSRRAIIGVLAAIGVAIQLAPMASAITAEEAWRWTRFTSASGLPDNVVHQIVECGTDSWVVTTTGFAAYDGYRWHPITSTDLPAGQVPIELHAQGAGRAMLVYPEGIWQLGPGARATRCAKPESGRFWSCVPRGADLLVQVTGALRDQCELRVLHEGALRPFPSPPGLLRRRERDLWSTAHGTLYAATSEGLFRWDGSHWTRHLTASDWASRSILNLQENERGDGCLATALPNMAASLWYWDAGTPPVEVPALGANRVRAATIGPDGELYVAYDTREIYELRNRQWLPHATPQLTDVTALGVQPDKDLWVATTDGLHMENRGPVRWEQLHNPDKGGSDRINEILRTRDGTMWFATSRGAMVQPPGGGLVVIRDADGQPLDEVTGLAEDDLGRVWLSSGRRPMGAYCFDGKWHHFGRQQHLDALCFHKIRRDRRGNLWFLGLSDHPDEQRSDGTGAFMFDGKTFTHWGGSDGLPNDRVYGFCEGPDGARWFGTAAGLGCYRNGRWQTWTQSTGLRCDRVFALDVDALGGVWFAQSIFGLGHLDAGGNLQFFDSDDGLSASEVTDLRFDERGWLWIATPDGLNVLRDGHITALRHDVGLVFSDLWPVLPLADCVYVGSLGHGVQVLKLAALDQRAPQLAIKEAAWQEDTATLSWSARGPWGLPGEGRVLTRYRIDAEPWSRWSTTEAIHRGSVLAGKHQLEVEAKGAFGSVTAPVRKTFQAPLLPYLRPLFYAPIAVSLLIAVACATVLIRRQRRHLRERRALEEQLRQVQKMEAIGRLAGGIAHDFNNLLTAINGYSDLVLSMLPDGSTARESIEKIQRAGERAASLTAQLLAFSRKQIVCDRTINLNEIALDLVDMLRRLLGEDIELELDLAPDLGLVRADPGQVQQVLLNLTVNARDAMNQGGHLIVRTRNDERAVEVRLAVSDTGCGIAAEHRAHLFEPFYTTKELGKGTGLGLAMVYGIVQQSGGRITVDSEPGCGTTFTIHLPRVAAVKPSGQADPVAPSESHGGETVLIVEDEPDVRSLMRDTLACSGYRVLEATDGVHALEVARSHGETIHLLLTDVVMPRSSGPELARQLARVRPETRVLYVSGYTGDARLDHHGAGRIAFIQKPFRATELKRRVHEVLHAPAAALAKR